MLSDAVASVWLSQIESPEDMSVRLRQHLVPLQLLKLSSAAVGLPQDKMVWSAVQILLHRCSDKHCPW